MKQANAIEQLLKDNNKNKIWLSEKLGYAGSSGISQMLMRGNITVETLCRICDALDYEVTVQPKRRVGVRPNGQIIIDGRGRE